MSNPRKSIVEGNLLASNGIISDSIGQYIVKIRKADNSNILAFKFAPSSLLKFFSTWYACGHFGFKNKKAKLRSVVKTTRKGIAEWFEKSRPFVCLTLKTTID
jgi:hypothetical protein